MGMFLKEFPYLLRDCLSVSVERLEFFRQQTLHYVRILLVLFHWEIYFQNKKMNIPSFPRIVRKFHFDAAYKDKINQSTLWINRGN